MLFTSYVLQYKLKLFIYVRTYVTCKIELYRLVSCTIQIKYCYVVYIWPPHLASCQDS